MRHRVCFMPIVAARNSYFETGLEIPGRPWLRGLKLAEVYTRLGVTTGSFYHYFTNWSAYTRELIGYWKRDRTDRLREMFSQRRSRKRMQLIIRQVLSLPHSAEAAIRAWSSVDPGVHAVQAEVDRQRFRRSATTTRWRSSKTPAKRRSLPTGPSTCWWATSRRCWSATREFTSGSATRCSTCWNPGASPGYRRVTRRPG